MAWDDPTVRQLYCFDHLVGLVWRTHLGLGWFTGCFKLLTEDAALLEFLSDWELMHPHFMEGDAQHHYAAMAAFELGVGEEVFEETAWRLENPEYEDQTMWLSQPPLIDQDLDRI